MRHGFSAPTAFQAPEAVFLVLLAAIRRHLILQLSIKQHGTAIHASCIGPAVLPDVVGPKPATVFFRVTLASALLTRKLFKHPSVLVYRQPTGIVRDTGG